MTGEPFRDGWSVPAEVVEVIDRELGIELPLGDSANPVFGPGAAAWAELHRLQMEADRDLARYRALGLAKDHILQAILIYRAARKLPRKAP